MSLIDLMSNGEISSFTHACYPMPDKSGFVDYWMIDGKMDKLWHSARVLDNPPILRPGTIGVLQATLETLAPANFFYDVRSTMWLADGKVRAIVWAQDDIWEIQDLGDFDPSIHTAEYLYPPAIHTAWSALPKDFRKGERLLKII